MKTRLFLAVAAAVALAGCGSKDDAAKAKPPVTEHTSGNPIAAPVNYLGAVGAAKKMAEKTIDTASVGRAIQQFQAMEERYPRDLRELVTQGYLREIPKAPYGMTYVYNPNTGQVLIVRTNAPAPVARTGK